MIEQYNSENMSGGATRQGWTNDSGVFTGPVHPFVFGMVVAGAAAIIYYNPIATGITLTGATFALIKHNDDWTTHPGERSRGGRRKSRRNTNIKKTVENLYVSDDM